MLLPAWCNEGSRPRRLDHRLRPAHEQWEKRVAEEGMRVAAAEDGVADELRVRMKGLVHALVLHWLDSVHVETDTRMRVRACQWVDASKAREASL